MGVKLRLATLDDLVAIQRLNHDLFVHDNRFNHDLNLEWSYTSGEQYFRDCITKPEQLVSIVAVEDTQVIGYLNARIQQVHGAYIGLRAEIENMCVAEVYRGKGVGTMLIEEFKKWARGKKADRLMVEAFSANDDAIGFYEKNGFEPYALVLSRKL